MCDCRGWVGHFGMCFCVYIYLLLLCGWRCELSVLNVLRFELSWFRMEVYSYILAAGLSTDNRGSTKWGKGLLIISREI